MNYVALYLMVATNIHSTPWGVTGPMWTQFIIHTREAVQPPNQNAAEVERLWCYSNNYCEEYLGQPCGEPDCDGVAICYILAEGHFVSPLPDGIIWIEGVLPDYTIFRGSWGHPADWNVNGVVDSQDLFNFFVAFFEGEADFNLDGHTSIVDLFDYLEYFLGG